MGFFNCKNCPAREPGCHAYCEEYKNSKTEHEKAKAWLRAEDELYQYQVASMLRTKENKRRRRKGDRC